jgi:dCMP deaminase
MYSSDKIKHFYQLAELVSTQSHCLKRKVGCILVKSGIIVSTGYNGPARNIPHCKVCRRVDSKTGENLHRCIGVHAESNCIANAARLGIAVEDSSLFTNTLVPCKNCISELVNAGVTRIYALDGYYDELSKYIEQHSGIRVTIEDEEEMLNG